jgi:hypothetical protein
VHAFIDWLPCFHLSGNVYNPMMDGWMKDDDGNSGWTSRWYNDEPTDSSIPISIITLPGSRLRVNDDKPKGKFESALRPLLPRLTSYLIQVLENTSGSRPPATSLRRRLDLTSLGFLSADVPN